MLFKVSYIFCKGNYFVDKLVNLALVNREQYKWFNILPPCIHLDFFS